MGLYLIPGSVSKHASKEGIHVPSVHGLAVLLDALSICKDQALPQQGVALSEAISDLPAGISSCLISSSPMVCVSAQIKLGHNGFQLFPRALAKRTVLALQTLLA